MNRLFGIFGVAIVSGLLFGRTVEAGISGEMHYIPAAVFAGLCLLIGALAIVSKWEAA